MTSGTAPRSEQRGIPDGLLTTGLLLLLGLTGLVWTATGTAALFARGAWPSGLRFSSTPMALRSLLTQPGDLPAAWPDLPARQLPGPGLFWGVLIGELMVLCVLAVFVIGTIARYRAVRAHRKSAPIRDTVTQGPPPGVPEPAHHPSPATAPAGPGHAPAGRPENAPSHPVPGQPVTGQPVTARPVTAQPSDPGPLHLTGDDPELRRDLALRAIHAARGPLLVVTSDPALCTMARDVRRTLGPTHVYDPGHLTDAPARVRWSPVAGCTSRRTSALRATALLAPVRPLRGGDPAVTDTATTLLGCWLHAAAVAGLPFRQVHRWASGASAHEPVRILRTHPQATSGSAGELESALTAHPERRSSAQELITLALGAMSAVHIRDACAPTRADSLAVESFAAEGGTLLVVGEAIDDPRTRPGAMPLLTALAADVVERGRRMAERSSAGRLDPPLTLVLDDIASVAPVPELPELLADAHELGMPTTLLVRSEEQLRARWPRLVPRG